MAAWGRRREREGMGRGERVGGRESEGVKRIRKKKKLIYGSVYDIEHGI